MAQGVKGHQDLQRLEKIREQEREDRLKKWHRKILTDPEASGVINLSSVVDIDSVLPPIEAIPGNLGPRTISMVSFMTGSNMAKTIASVSLVSNFSALRVTITRIVISRTQHHVTCCKL